MRLLAIAASLIAFIPSGALALPINWNFSASIKAVEVDQGGLFPGVAAGDLFSGKIVLDPDTPGVAGSYPGAAISADFSLGGVSAAVSAGVSSGIEIEDFALGSGTDRFRLSLGLASGMVGGNPLAGATFALLIEDVSGALLANSGLPLTSPDLNLASSQEVLIDLFRIGPGGLERFRAQATLTDVVAVIPEPAGAALFTIGLALAGRRLAKGRR